MAIDIAEYKTLYIKTARDLIRSMQTALQQMNNEACNQYAIGNFHRAAHSFKSQSLVMGYTQTGLVAKVLEQLFRDMKEQISCATQQTISLIEHTVQKLDDSLISIENQTGELDFAQETQELSKLTSIPVL